MDIQISQGIDEAHWQHLTNWRERVFPIEGKDFQWSQAKWHLLAFQNDMPIAHIGFDRFVLDANEELIQVVGVGGVVVRPEYQGRNIPRELFEHLHNETPNILGLSRFTLFCPERLVSYYNRHGYKRYEGEVTFDQNGRQVGSSFQFVLRGFELEAKKISIPSLPW